MGKANLFHKRKRREHNLTRRINTRDEKDRFLIVCEGAKTEPLYFKSFKVRTANIQIIGAGDNTVSLVNKTIELKREDDYDQVWCVFDRDSFPNGEFNKAIELANSNGIRAAYSNESFELWFLLHFCYLDTALTRHQYNERLSRYLGKKYSKNDPLIFEQFLDLEKTALKNAEKLYNSYEYHTNPENNKPSTTVHFLVDQLRKHC